MKRLCVFAHYDKDNIIDDYVIYYLNSLKEVCNDIIFVSDNDLPEQETSMLKGIVTDVLAQKHGEYDFGSYKRGFLHPLTHEKDYDEIIFANDSCYGPLYSLKPIFDKMQKSDCDYWGLTKNSYGVCTDNNPYKSPPWSPHIQSYFLVFRSKVFKSQVFIDFVKNIKKENSKNEIIANYEVGLSQLLKKAHFKDDVYIKKYKYIQNYPVYKWDILIKKHKFPFIKTSNIKNGLHFKGEIKGWREVISTYTNYPLDLIEKNSNRLKDLYENKYDNENLYRRIRFDILLNLPAEIRPIIIFTEKKVYKILNTICFNKLKKF